MTSAPLENRRKLSAAGWGFAGLLLLLLLMSLGLAFAGYGTLADARQFNRTIDYIWGVIALGCSVILFFGSVAALVHLKSQSRRARRVGLMLLASAAATNCVLVVIGATMVANAKARGGDWGALHAGMTSLFCVDAPLLLAILTGIAVVCHRQLGNSDKPNGIQSPDDVPPQIGTDQTRTH